MLGIMEYEVEDKKLTPHTAKEAEQKFKRVLFHKLN